MAPRHHNLNIGSDSIAVVTLDLQEKSVNILTSELIDELDQTFKRLHAMKEVRGVLIRSDKPKQFIAGADIEEIVAITNLEEAEEKAKKGQNLMTLIETLPFPAVASIDGPCLGGGMEFALACRYRVAGEGSHVRLGLPEVKLGIVPGFGGTQRMPKVVGLLKSLDLILTGRTLDSARALKMGLVDDVTASEILDDVAKEWLIKSPKVKRPSRISKSEWIMQTSFPLRRLVLRKTREKVTKESKGFYPAPLAAVDVIAETYRNKKINGYDVEARKVSELVASDVSKSLMHIFMATESIRREKYEPGPKPVQKVGIIGAGVMGAGLAYLLSSKDKVVRLRDISVEPLSKAMNQIYGLHRKDFERKRIARRELRMRVGRVSPTSDFSGFARTDFVIEAVIEKLEIKKQVFSELSRRVRPETILASNTSALPIGDIAAVTPNPQNVIGLHFFNPVHKMPLVEVIRGRETSDSTVSTTVAFALAIGKTPIVVADRPGFLVNRILGAYLNEAALAAEDGAPVAEIEQAMKAFGLPMGPFELMDEVGLDIAQEVGEYLHKELPHFARPSGLIGAIRQDGRLGKKSGKGFYLHGKRRTLDTAAIQKALSAVSKKPTLPMADYTDLVDRMVLLMVNEAARCLQEGVVQSSRDVDVGMVLGTGFAPFRGGLLAYANHRGLADVAQNLTRLAKENGEHFRPVERIKELAEKNALF